MTDFPFYTTEQLKTIIPEARGKPAPITRQAVHNLAKRHEWFTEYRGLYDKKLIDEYLEEIE
jgi:hypothetical protein